MEMFMPFALPNLQCIFLWSSKTGLSCLHTNNLPEKFRKMSVSQWSIVCYPLSSLIASLLIQSTLISFVLQDTSSKMQK